MTVAITGGARGIGLATARAFASAGARVVIGDVDADAVRHAADGFGGTGLPLDVRDADSFARFLVAAGQIDVLVNNAGVAPAARFLDIAPALADLTVDVNLRGVLHGMRLALPTMVARGGGHVINVVSLSARVPLPGAAVYAATKAGVLSLTETVRDEIAGSGVRLTAVLPTFVRTDIVSGIPLRGVPSISADQVAREIVKLVRRGGDPAVVTVPRWLGGLPRLAAMLPYRTVESVRRRAAGGRFSTVDMVTRAPYEDRIARLTGQPAATGPTTPNAAIAPAGTADRAGSGRA